MLYILTFFIISFMALIGATNTEAVIPYFIYGKMVCKDYFKCEFGIEVANNIIAQKPCQIERYQYEYGCTINTDGFVTPVLTVTDTKKMNVEIDGLCIYVKKESSEAFKKEMKSKGFTVTPYLFSSAEFTAMGEVIAPIPTKCGTPEKPNENYVLELSECEKEAGFSEEVIAKHKVLFKKLLSSDDKS